MRREDRARDADFAWAVFDQASHSVLSMRDGEGGYGVPISPARVGQRVYFHCALEGKKRACLAAWPEVTMSAVSAVEPAYFAANYRSAVLRGTASLVTDPAERLAALAAISRRYCPDLMDQFDAYAAALLERTAVYRLDVDKRTGKERCGK